LPKLLKQKQLHKTATVAATTIAIKPLALSPMLFSVDESDVVRR
jgi:hypothetical protein